MGSLQSDNSSKWHTGYNSNISWPTYKRAIVFNLLLKSPVWIHRTAAERWFSAKVTTVTFMFEVELVFFLHAMEVKCALESNCTIALNIDGNAFTVVV